jgi:hypothetical protein
VSPARLALLVAAPLAALIDEHAQARLAAARWGPRAVLIEVRAPPEAEPGPLTWVFADYESEASADLLLLVTLRAGAPAVRVLNEPKLVRRPALDVSRVGAQCASLQWPRGERASRWSGCDLRALRDGAPCWRARNSEGQARAFDATTGAPSAACEQPWAARDAGSG